MLNSAILIKVKQRLNKLASNDYDNIECWQVVEAFNKGMVEWCRRNLHGLNQKQEGDEQSKRRIDDLQKLMVSTTITMNNKQLYFESPDLPENYFEWKRVSAKSINTCCTDPAHRVAALGQGANDAGMLRAAGLGICVLSPEGTAGEALQAADVLLPDIVAALGLLQNPRRLLATLRRGASPPLSTQTPNPTAWRLRSGVCSRTPVSIPSHLAADWIRSGSAGSRWSCSRRSLRSPCTSPISPPSA